MKSIASVLFLALAALLAACATETTTTTDKSGADGKNCEYRTGSNICRR